jgi:hypothetical protein
VTVNLRLRQRLQQRPQGQRYGLRFLQLAQCQRIWVGEARRKALGRDLPSPSVCVGSSEHAWPLHVSQQSRERVEEGYA